MQPDSVLQKLSNSLTNFQIFLRIGRFLTGTDLKSNALIMFA